MDIIGIVGGVGPESTALYYRGILAAARERFKDLPTPQIIINSIDNPRMLGFVSRGDLEALAEYLGDEIERLERAGATFGLLASNTPHLVFDRLEKRATIPLVSIVECAADASKRASVRRLGLLGTRFTMQGSFYAQVFSRRGLEVVAPDDPDLSFVHDKYMNELVPGIVRDETREALGSVASRMKADKDIDAILLAGTELSLILGQPTVSGLPVLDTTKLHVDAIVERWSRSR